MEKYTLVDGIAKALRIILKAEDPVILRRNLLAFTEGLEGKKWEGEVKEREDSDGLPV